MNTNPKLSTDIYLTTEEKRILRMRVFTHVQKDIPKVSISRFSFHSPKKYLSPLYIIKKTSHFMSIFFLLALSGASFSAAYALPGDTLYPFKIAGEDLDTRMTSKPTDKILIQKKHLEKRFSEAEALSKKQISSSVSLESTSDLEKNITSQVQAIQNTAKEILHSDPTTAKEVLSDISISLAERQVKEIESRSAKSTIQSVVSPEKIEPLLLSLQKTTESFSDSKNIPKEKEGKKDIGGVK